MIKILCVTNMFPNKRNPYFGRFVEANFAGLSKKFDVDLIKIDEGNVLIKLFNYLILYCRIFSKYKKYDLIYFHFPTRTSLPLLFIEAPFILNFHGSDINSNSIINKLLILLLKNKWKKSLLNIVPSIDLGDILKKLINRNYFVSPSSGVPDFFYNYYSKEIHKESSIFLSSILEEKGVFDLFQAILELQKNNFYIRLDVYGHLPVKNLSRFNQYLNKTKGYIKYKGMIDHKKIPQIISKHKVFIFPSRRESLGLVGLESLAVGVPVIGSNLKSTRIYLKNKLNSLIFETGNINDLKRKIKKIFEEPELYEYLRSNAKKSVNHYRESEVIKNLNNRIFYEISSL